MSTALLSLISLAVMFTVITSMLSSIFDSHEQTAQALLRDQLSARRVSLARVVALAAAATGDASGTTVDVTLGNEGDITYAEFDEWDVNVEYVNASGNIEIRWLPYASTIADNSWTVQGIYLDASASTAEVVDGDVLNADEEIVIRLRVTPAVGSGATGRVVLTPPNSGAASIFFTG